MHAPAARTSVVGRIVYVAALPMALLLPCWATMGRLVIGVGGWLTILMMVVVLPVGVLLLGSSAIVLLVRRRDARAAGPATVISVMATWAAWAVLPLCIGDAGESESETVNAPLTTWFGISGRLLDDTALVVAGIALVGALVTLVLTVAERPQPSPVLPTMPPQPPRW